MLKQDFAVIMPAAGRSTRFGDPREKKIFSELEGRAVWLRALEPFVRREDVTRIVVAIAAEDRELFERRYGANIAFLDVKLVEGGAERSESVARALAAIDRECEFVAVHDAARPCVSDALVESVFQAARAHGAAVPGLAIADTIKRVDAAGVVLETVPRADLVAVQTPQAFRRDWLEAAYAGRDPSAAATDDAQLVENLGHRVQVVEGSALNIKITRAEDLRVAAAYLRNLESSRRPSGGHPFADERAMW